MGKKNEQNNPSPGAGLFAPPTRLGLLVHHLVSPPPPPPLQSLISLISARCSMPAEGEADPSSAALAQASAEVSLYRGLVATILEDERELSALQRLQVTRHCRQSVLIPVPLCSRLACSAACSQLRTPAGRPREPAP